ncbi:hypothetical protein BGV52_21150 [Burkholderia ubonensis]|uniref:hypothetical protein n=1 Tax=Burkholderia ubonensis TaxID=101571 RepID=UPI0007532F93|nr:hypothetical protein [Burkholderia ubonensis]KWK06003.1 hypothetical protein WM11_11455 [Burkholderia ubonensis]KWK56498.1 hypothetical protein WM14_26955 [Burkholderia ubonensis]OJB07306.1 hypothetical protein BGV52_21150 [Burkholderia ubonensis]
MLSIIETTIVLVAMAFLTLQGIKDDVAKRRREVLTAEGKNEAVINAALANWVTDNYGNLVAQLVAPGPTAVTPPTLAQLQSAGYLKANFAPGPFWGGTYTVQMSVGPAGCSTSASGCRVSYLLYPSKPVTRNGQPDVAGAGIVAQAAGNGFGFSKAQNSATVFGLNGAWTAANPVSGAPAAVVMATNGPTTDGNSVYIRRDGSLTWTGDQNANGVSINNLKNVTATGNVQGAQLLSSTNGNVSRISNDGSGNTNVYQSGALQVLKDGTSTYAPVHSGDVISEGVVRPGAVAVPRTWCPTNGAGAQNSDGRGQWLSCQDHVWLPIGGTALRHNYYAVQNGWGVPAPSCSAGGTPAIVVTLQNVFVDTTATVNVTTSGSGPWTVWITDGSGSGIAGSAVAETYCGY